MKILRFLSLITKDSLVVVRDIAVVVFLSFLFFAILLVILGLIGVLFLFIFELGSENPYFLYCIFIGSFLLGNNTSYCICSSCFKKLGK